MSVRNGSNVNVGSLTSLYRSGAVPKAVFDSFARRQKNSAKTTVDRLQSSLRQEGYDIPRSELVAFFRQLEEANCGQFVIGRKGHPSRFEWITSLISVGQAASGEVTKVDTIAESGSVEEAEEDIDGQMLDHRYLLRPGLELKFTLPQDLTQGEASRIADFVRTLPFV